MAPIAIVNENERSYQISSANGISKSKADVNNSSIQRNVSIHERLADLFTENVVAKMIRVAQNGLIDNNPPNHYPEWVPQSGSNAGIYDLREKDFWTCGFFPGTLYSLLARGTLHPSALPVGTCSKQHVLAHLHSLAKTWSGPIYPMATRTDTHDMSFIIQPALRLEYELYGTPEALDAVLTAARSLASRYNANAKAIRSWDGLWQNGRVIESMDEDFLVIIDSMMNLDLLFYAAAQLSSPELADMASAHARTVAEANLRLENMRPVKASPFKGSLYSTFHVVNISPVTGEIKDRLTAQGFADHSTWARGQAWGIFGYAQTYHWTKDAAFLEIACGLAEYFIRRLEDSPMCVERAVDDADTASFRANNRTKGRHVPLWDFDAPIDESIVLRDSSAGVIAANGLLLLYQALTGQGRCELAQWYLAMAVTIVEDALAFSLSRHTARFGEPENQTSGNTRDQVFFIEDDNDGRFDAILKNATANYNARDHKRYWDHGLAYGDYYLVEFGNRLLRMGLV